MASGAELRVADIAEGTHQVYSGIMLVLLHFSPNTSGYLLAILGHSACAAATELQELRVSIPYLGTVLVLLLCSISFTEATLAVCMKYLDLFCCHYRVLVDSVSFCCSRTSAQQILPILFAVQSGYIAFAKTIYAPLEVSGKSTCWQGTASSMLRTHAVMLLQYGWTTA